MKKFLSNNKSFLITFAVIFAASLICCILKCGMHVDEIYTFGLANSHFAPFFNNVTGDAFGDMFISKSQIMGYLTVQPGERFDYASVFYNQGIDTLPPLYSCIINTVSSFFPDKFSIWFGLSVNLICWAFVLVFLYKTLIIVIENKRFSAMMTAVYGLSQIGLSTLLMIRMYIVATLFTVVLVYLFVKNEKEEKQFRYPLIFLTVYLGALAHYVFVIFAFFLIAFTDFYLLKNKQFKRLVKYSVSSLAGIILMAVSFPQVRDQFFADRGVSGSTAVKNLTTPYKWAVAAQFYTKGTAIGIPALLLILIAVFGAVLLLALRKSVKSTYRGVDSCVTVITLASAVSYVLSALTSPAYAERYIYNLIPVFVVSAGYFAYKSYCGLTEKSEFKGMAVLKKTALPLVIVISILYASFVYTPSYIYRDYRDYRGYTPVAAEYSQYPCVFFGKSLNIITISLDQLKEYNGVFVAESPDSEKLGEYIKNNSSDKLVVYIETNDRLEDVFNSDEVIGKLMQIYPQYKSAEKLYVMGPTEIGTAETYVLSK